MTERFVVVAFLLIKSSQNKHIGTSICLFLGSNEYIYWLAEHCFCKAIRILSALARQTKSISSAVQMVNLSMKSCQINEKNLHFQFDIHKIDDHWLSGNWFVEQTVKAVYLPRVLKIHTLHHIRFCSINVTAPHWNVRTVFALRIHMGIFAGINRRLEKCAYSTQFVPMPKNSK